MCRRIAINANPLPFIHVITHSIMINTIKIQLAHMLSNISGKVALSTVAVFVLTALGINAILLQGNTQAAGSHEGGHAEEEVIGGGKKSAFPIVTVEQPKTADTVQVSIEAAGQVFAKQQANLYPSQDGIIQSLSVNLGSRVRQGQVLAVLRADQSQQQLAADIEFKKQELSIARERASLTTDAHLRTTEEERSAELNRMDAEINGLVQIRAQTLLSIRHVGYDLLENMNELLFTRSEGIDRFNQNSAYDYYRRIEAFSGFGNDYAVREKFEQKIQRFRNTLREKDSVPMDIAVDADSIGREARDIALRISESPAFDGEEIDRIRKEIGETTDHLSETMSELTKNTAELASLEAEKRKINATTEREIVDVKGSKKNADLDADIIAADVVRLKRQMGAGRAIIAPFSGVITKRYVNAGESVTLEKPVFNIVNDRSKYIRFNISEADLPFVKVGTTVTFAPTSAPSEKFTAVIKRIAQAVDPDSRTIQVEADVPTQKNADRVLAQMTIRVQIPVTHDPSLLVLPEAALQLSKHSNTVWTVNPDVETAAKQVEVAFIHSGFAYIKSGLTAKDWIVVKSPVELTVGLAIDTKQL